MNDVDQAIKRTGVIGLGAMGLQMARHMAGKGFDVAGYDLDADAMRRAAGHGVTACRSAAEVGKHAQVVIVMVATDSQVEDVIERSGLLGGLGRGSVICIASSCAPDTCRRMAEIAATRGVGLIDCPVVLGQEAANNGTVTAYVGGEEQWFRRAQPVLAAFSRQASRRRRQRPGREDHQQHAVLGRHGGKLRGAEPRQGARRRHCAPDRGARPRQRRQLVALPLGQEHW
jgi:6-phosphogluconate dehydrogenase (decarboxylating)